MSFATVEPATGRVVKEYDTHTPEEVDAKLERADQAFREYRTTSFEDRARLVRGAADLLEAEQPDIARVMTTEMGKTFGEAKAEVGKCARALRWYAEEGAGLLADEVVETSASRSLVHYQPLGPVLAVMPWNFPLWQVMRFAAPSLMAGNVGLLKHASNVPETALLLEDVFRRAGFPEGVFTTLLVPSSEIAAVIHDPRVAAVTLTGSNAAGQSVAAAAGDALKKTVLELGGSDPFVVLASADLDKAASVGVRARVQNNGQSCIAAKRFIVVEPVADAFIERFVDEMRSLRVGDPFVPSTDVGPLATDQQREQLSDQVEDARAKGADVLCGGEAPEGPGWYYSPTVLCGLTPEMKVDHEEVFGPVALVYRAADLDDALEIANRTEFGLGASAWTRDQAEIDRCVDELASGMVFVNAMVASTPELPFGGVKASGYGRELSGFGIKEFCNAKSVWID